MSVGKELQSLGGAEAGGGGGPEGTGWSGNMGGVRQMCLTGKQKEFVVDPVADREPVELLQTGGDVMMESLL